MKWVDWTRLLLAAVLTPALAATSPCPSTRTQWQKWKVSLLSNNTLKEHSQQLIDYITKCENTPTTQEFLKDPNFAACLKPLKDALRNWSGNAVELPFFVPDTSSLITVNDERYFSEAGESVTLPNIFFSARFNKQLIYNPDASLRELQYQLPGHTTVNFRSAVLQDQHDTSGSIVVTALSTDSYDKFIHYGAQVLADNDSPLYIVVGVKKKDASGAPYKIPQVFYAFYTGPDVFLERPPLQLASRVLQDKTWNLKRSAAKNAGACIQCHQTGTLQLIPQDQESLKSGTPGLSGAEALRKVNALLKKDAARGKPAYVISEGLGPRIGELPNEELISACATLDKALPAPLSSNEIQRIRSAMNCTECHNGSHAPELHAPLGTAGVGSDRGLLQRTLERGMMPPANDLSQQERQALFNCLQQEFYAGLPTVTPLKGNGRYVSWMLGPNCE